MTSIRFLIAGLVAAMRAAHADPDPTVATVLAVTGTAVLLGTLTMLVGAGWDMATADTSAESASTQPRMFSIGGAF